jgi:hypothetical protein
MNVNTEWEGWYAAPAPFGRTTFILKILEATGLIFFFNKHPSPHTVLKIQIEETFLPVPVP